MFVSELIYEKNVCIDEAYVLRAKFCPSNASRARCLGNRNKLELLGLTCSFFLTFSVSASVIT